MAYKKGDWWVICDICGLKYRKSQTRMNWKKQVVCTDSCYEERNAQEFVRGLRDRQSVPDPRPRPDPIYLSPGDVTADDL